MFLKNLFFLVTGMLVTGGLVTAPSFIAMAGTNTWTLEAVVQRTMEVAPEIRSAEAEIIIISASAERISGATSIVRWTTASKVHVFVPAIAINDGAVTNPPVTSIPVTRKNRFLRNIRYSFQ